MNTINLYKNINMKNYLSFLLLAFSSIVLFSACENEEIMEPVFTVFTTGQATTYKVGDTIQFNFSGKPDILTFYSGEVGKNYDLRERFTAAGINKLSFKTTMQQGPVPPAVSQDVLSLLISTDLKGYDPESIAKATWTDITARNTKWPTALSTTFTSSDQVDISDFNTADKVNIAFRFIGKPNPSFPQRKWQVSDLTLNNTLADGTVTPLFFTPPTTLPAFLNTGWVQASLKNDLNYGTPTSTGYNAWNVGTWNVSATNNPTIFTTPSGLKAVNTNGIVITNVYPITFDPGTTVNNAENEDWLITTAIDLKKTNADVGTVIKTALTKSLQNYRYIFRKPGVYKVTFDAVNNDVNNTKRVIKQIEITVNP
jgi:Cu/Ag efflux protein CusF